MRHRDQHLLIDADDTLWENHAYFLDALAAFGDLVEERDLPRARAFEALTSIERARTKEHGYGSRLFVASLKLAYTTLIGPLSAADQTRLDDLGERIFSHPVVPFKGVAEALEELGARQQLWLVTKGQPDEQLGKLKRSGLLPLFHDARVLREKDTDTYRRLLETEGLDPVRTWMIGNAPKSDILAAAGAGLRTVFIPHRTTWFMEEVAIDPPPTLELTRFRHLTGHF